MGSAIAAWTAMDGAADRTDYVVATEEIPRVVGSMAIQLHDGIWLFASHGFPPESAPLIINNACWSWHELSQRTTFAGARGYLGSLYPVLDPEAQEMGQRLFTRYLGLHLVDAVWQAQRDIYGASPRRPYVLVGLPFVSVKPNYVDAVKFLDLALVDSIAHWYVRAKDAPWEDVRQNAARFTRFLIEELDDLRNNLSRRRHPDQ